MKMNLINNGKIETEFMPTFINKESVLTLDKRSRLYCIPKKSPSSICNKGGVARRDYSTLAYRNSALVMNYKSLVSNRFIRDKLISPGAGAGPGQCNNALSVTSLENHRYSSFVMRRKYTSLVRDTPHDLSDKFVSRLLNVFIDPKNTLVNNRESQKKIEKILFDEYDVLFSSNTSKYIGGINTEMLGSVLSKYLMDKYSVLNKYIDYLFSQQTQLLANIDKLSDKNKFDSILTAKVITSLDKKFICDLCLYQFIVVYSYQNTEFDKNYASLVVSIKIGKKMFNKYINNLKDDYINESNNPISYTLFLDKWENDNSKLALIVEDNFYALMGCKLIDILIHSDILSMALIKSADKEHPYQALQVKDKTLMSTREAKSVITTILLIPMKVERSIIKYLIFYVLCF